MDPIYSRAIAEAPVILFAGAGASHHLGRPVMAQLYHQLDNKLREPDDTAAVWQAFSQAPPRHNVERILEMAETYRDSWDSLEAVGALEEGRPPHNALAVGALLSGQPTPERPSCRRGAARIAVAIKQQIVAQYGGTASVAELGQCYLPFLESLLRLSDHAVLPIFTTNYDLVLDSIEGCTGQLGLNWEAGFKASLTGGPARWQSARIDQLGGSGPRTIVLFKLHGSVSWEREGGDVLVTFDARGAPRPATEGKALIWPALTKVARDEPFRRAYEYLGRCLDNARLAVFVGYGFQDVGVMERVRAAVRHNRGLQIVVVDPEPKAEAFKQWGLEWSQDDHIALPLAPDSVAEVCDSLETSAAAPGAPADALPASVLGRWERTAGDWELEIVEGQRVRLGGTSAGWKELVWPDTYTNLRFSAEVLQEGDDDWAALFFRRRGEADCWALMAQSGAVTPKRIRGPGPEDQDEWEPVWVSEASLADRWVELSIEVRGEEARLKARSSGGGWSEEKSVRDAEGLQGPIALACRQGDHAAQFRNIRIERL